LDEWRNKTIGIKMKAMDEFLKNFGDEFSEMKANVSNLQNSKLDMRVFRDYEPLIDKKLLEINETLCNQKDDTMTLEHYAERYIPI